MTHFIKTIFTIHKIKRLIIGETIGKFFAFLIGLWSAKLFTFNVLERKDLHNLFGILHRKEIVVHRTPHWVELLFAAFIGFLVMELFYYVFQSINSKWIWRKILRVFILLKWKLKK
jgi:hypothetical protein